MTNATGVVLPGQGDYDSALSALHTGVAYLETVAEVLRPLTPRQPELVSYRPSRVPTYEDIGKLWSFIDSVKLMAESVNDHVGELEEAMVALDMAREERWSA